MKKLVNLIPSLFTTLNLFFGFYAIISAFNHNYQLAGLLIIYGALCDLLDGKLARLFKISNEIGKEMDSFSDFVTFGVAPAILVYSMIIPHYSHMLGMVICLAISFLYCLSAALRLAIFNIGTYYKNVKKTRSYSFIGVPSTLAGLTIGSIAAYHSFYSGILYESRIDFSQMPIFVLSVTAFLSIAMLAPVEYPRFLDIYFNIKSKKSTIVTTILLVLLFLFSRIVYLVTILYTVTYPIFVAFIKCFFHKKINMKAK